MWNVGSEAGGKFLVKTERKRSEGNMDSWLLDRILPLNFNQTSVKIGCRETLSKELNFNFIGWLDVKFIFAPPNAIYFLNYICSFGRKALIVFPVILVGEFLEVLTDSQKRDPSVADPDPGSGIGCLFDPGSRDPGWEKVSIRIRARIIFFRA